MSWDQKLFGRFLSTRRFGRELVWLESVDSTNRWMADNHRQFAMSGGTVAADHQNAGQGRFDRKWFDQPEECLLFSTILHYRGKPELMGLLNLMPAIALADVIASHGHQGNVISLKWPNDVHINGKKIAGVLGQSSTSGEQAVAIIGMGVNIGIKREDFPPEFSESAGSILTELGSSVPREILLAEILKVWEELFDGFLAGDLNEVRLCWEKYGPAPGARLQRTEPGLAVQGRFAGLGDFGQLLLQTDEGGIRSIFSGDVSQ